MPHNATDNGVASNGVPGGRSRLKIIICGGGIAGFAAALLLREDHDVTVLESSLLNEEMGAAITLSINASRLLRSCFARAGFDPVRGKFVEAEKLQVLHWQNLSVLHETHMEMVTSKYGQPWWYFSRKDVHGELKRAALSADGLGTVPTLELGAHVDRVDLDSRTVYLNDGRSFQGDVIIGADGIRSASGNSVFGKLVSESQGFSAYRCMISSEKMQNDSDMSILVDCAKVLVVIGPDRRIVAYPCSNWKYINFVCIFPDATERQAQWTTSTTVQDMVNTFHDFHPALTKALAAASDAGVWQLRDRRPLSTLAKGCFALIGDAAHAMGPHQGQGGCQALEDAEGLRVVLKGATQDTVAERLQIFNQLRLERVNTVIEYTRNMGPKHGSSSTASPATSEAYSDYFWSYKITPDAVALMNKHGYAMKVVDVETGEIEL